MPISHIDKTLVRRRFTRGATTYANHAVVQQRMARTLVDALVDVTGHTPFQSVFEPGCGDGTLTRHILNELGVERLTVNDIAEAFRGPIHDLAAKHPDVVVDFVPGDVEHITWPPALDLVAANAVLQWVEDLGAFHEHVRHALKPEGVLAFSTFGERNVPELAAITGQSLGYRTFAEHRALLKERFEILRAWETEERIALPSGRDVLRHLKATGVNALVSQHWTKGALAAFEKRYGEQFAVAGGVSLTFHPLYFIVKPKERASANP
jgi:malonyl-CoA O-methyltransferase